MLKCIRVGNTKVTKQYELKELEQINFIKCHRPFEHSVQSAIYKILFWQFCGRKRCNKQNLLQREGASRSGGQVKPDVNYGVDKSPFGKHTKSTEYL